MNNAEVVQPAARLIGCAGWTLPKDALATFPAEGTHLQRYAAVFPVTEINSSFHRPHRAQTHERWAASVPDGFRFSVKLPRTITHDARLCGAQELLDRFAGEAGALGDKLGCVLVQLPPTCILDNTASGSAVPNALTLLHAQAGQASPGNAILPAW